MPSVAQLIRQRARKHGVDPRAAIAVARGEGGLRRGAVGDSGTSFGPFQLHRGGAMPAGRSAAWASSPQGIDYAIRKMAESGARGLTGPKAVETIIRRFERPADPDSSVRNALGRYGQGVSFSEQPYTGGGGGIGEMPDFAGSLGKAGIGEMGRRSSEMPDFASQLGKGKVGKGIPGFSLDTAPSFGGSRQTGGPAGAAPIGALMPSNNLGARAVKQAATQLGDPYVFGASSAGRNPGSFDCSSLVQWAYRQLGVNVPRDTRGQQAALPLKPWSQLQPGDPIYRRSGGHVVIYAGNGKVIAAPHTGTVVQYQDLSNFPQSDWEVRAIR